MASKAAIDLAVAKLAESALGPEDAKALGFDVLDGAAVAAFGSGFANNPALVINYFHPITREPLRAAPKWPPFIRYRYLGPKGTLPTNGKKEQKYVQASGTGVCAYFPMNADWKKILEGSDTIFITEGELKAAKACQMGFPTIGLGGVWNFRSVQTEAPFLPELDMIEWAQRTVVIVYDSDIITNENIQEAANALAELLRDRGAFPHILILTGDADGKVGLDDWFVAHPSAKKFKQLLNDSASSLTLAKPLFDFNRRYALVESPFSVLDRALDRPMNVEQFKVVNGKARYNELKIKDGAPSMKLVSAAEAWLKWPMRSDFKSITYHPGQPRIIDGPHGSIWNSWKGFATKPVKGDVSLYLKLVDHLFSTAEPEAKDWFLKWCAYPIQFPGSKMYCAATIHGTKNGTGKSFLFYCLRRIYGSDNFSEIDDNDIHSDFNGWALNKQFVLGDDITGHDKRELANALKKKVTQKELKVNIKFVPSYSMPDRINYGFTSNQPDAQYMEDDDRRFFIHKIEVDPLPNAFYHDLEAWLETEEGGNALHYFFNTLPMGNFDYRERALETAAKREMVDLSKSQLELWVAQLKNTPELVLTSRVGEVAYQGDLYSSAMLTNIYNMQNPDHKITVNGMGKALGRADFKKVLKGEAVRWGRGQERFFIVRNHEFWHKNHNNRAVVKAHIEKVH